MKRFYEVEDYTIESIWDELLSGIPALPNRPQGWNAAHPESKGMEGNWSVALAMHNQASPEAYKQAGIVKPSLTQIPAIFCVDLDTGVVESEYNVTAQRALEFIQTRI